MKEERYVSKITVILIKTRLQNIVGKRIKKLKIRRSFTSGRRISTYLKLPRKRVKNYCNINKLNNKNQIVLNRPP
jgi:hypothetical protein